MVSLFIGVAVTATALSILQSIRSTQERQLSAHAQTDSQQAIWTAVEAIQLHLQSLEPSELLTFEAENNTVENAAVIGGVFSGNNDVLKAQVISPITANMDSNTPPAADGTYNVKVHFTAIDSLSQSASNLEVIYRVKPKVPPVPYVIDGNIGFYGDSQFDGGIKLDGPGSGKINVDGNMFAGGSIGGSGLSHVGVTGDAILKGSVTAESLTANGNVYLSGSADGAINASGYPGLGKGNIYIDANNAQAVELFANGNIRLANTSKHTDIKARGRIEITNEARARDLIAATDEDDASEYFLIALEPNQTLKDKMDQELAEGTSGDVDSTTYQLEILGKQPYIDGYAAGTDLGYSSDYIASLGDYGSLLTIGGALYDPLVPSDLENAAHPRNTISFGGGSLGRLEAGIFLPDESPLSKLGHEFYDSVTTDSVTGKYKLAEAIFGQVKALGEITRTGGEVYGDIVSETQVDCVKDWWVPTATTTPAITPKVKAPSISPSPSACLSGGVTAPENLEPLDLGVDALGNDNAGRDAVFTALAPFVMPPPPTLNARDLKEHVNYAFEPDSASTRLFATVRNINNIPQGGYFLGRFNADSRYYLCKNVDEVTHRCQKSEGGVLSNADKAEINYYPLCGMGSSGSCFGYDADTKTWTIDGEWGIVRGTLWFDGNLTIGKGAFFNSFIVTGNFLATDNFYMAAPNFAGVGPMCNNAASFEHTNSAGQPIVIEPDVTDTDLFFGQYPTQVCDFDVTPAEYNHADDLIGNISVLAGSVIPGSDPEEYTGGQVGFGGTAEVMGVVLAADVVDIGGSATIYGYIVATGKGDGTINVIDSGAKVDTTGVPSHIGVIPGVGATDGSDAGLTTVLWSKYL